MVIGALNKLQEGTHWDKIRKSWRAETLLQEIENLVNQLHYIIPSHTRRDCNEAADYLANWGCQHRDRHLDITPSARAWNIEFYSLQRIVDRDLRDRDIRDNPRSGCGSSPSSSEAFTA